MTFTYNENNIITTGDIWADPMKGGTASGPIVISQDGLIDNNTGLGRGLWLKDGTFKLTVNGALHGLSTGLVIQPTASGSGSGSSLTIGATGSISSNLLGISFEEKGTISNAGAISSGAAAIWFWGGTITNAASGTITGHGTSAGDIGGIEAIIISGDTKIVNKGRITGHLITWAGGLTLDNSGVIDGRVYLGSGGADVLKNSGIIFGDVETGPGIDKFTNTGQVIGEISLWSGDDTFTGGKYAETLRDEGGSDTYKFGDGIDTFKAVTAESYDGTDIVDGGTQTGANIALGIYGDIYDASAATDRVFVNLDSKVHFNSGTYLAQTATGGGVGIDKIKGFETVRGGEYADIIFGDKAANMLLGNGSTDSLYGGAGNDLIKGGNGGDFIYGQAGADQLYGESGADYFIYEAVSESTAALSGRDTIFDFEAGVDKIVLPFVDALGINFLGLNGAFVQGDVNPQVRILQTANGWTAQVDSNGDRKVDMAIDIADAGHLLTLSAGDFTLPD